MKVRTSVRAGVIATNHAKTRLSISKRPARKRKQVGRQIASHAAARLKIRSNVRAGQLTSNHAATRLARTRGREA